MNEIRRKGERLLALFLLGGITFSYPVLSIFNRPDLISGIPVAYLYLFLAWAGLILLLALVAEGKGSQDPPGDGDA